MSRDRKKHKGKSGNGLFRVRETGSFEYRFPYKDASGNSKRKSVSGKTEDECISKAENFLKKAKQHNQGFSGPITLIDLLTTKYKNDFKLNYIGAATCRKYLASLVHIKKTSIARMPIENIRKEHIDIYLLTLTQFANSNIKKYFQQLCLGFTLAYEQDIISKNIMQRSDIRCPRSIKPDKRIRGYTMEEQNKITRAIVAHKVPFGRNDYRRQLFIELYTGMRMGEINALKPDDIDFEKGVINVSRTVSRGFEYEAYIKEGTKTDAGMRSIPINKKAEAVLKDAINNQPNNPYNLLFYDARRNNVLSTCQVNGFFSRICEKAGVERIGQHALRHTFATRCIEAGIAPVVLKTWMGHTNIHITLDTYADVFEGMHNDAIKQFDGYLNDKEE